MKARKKVSSCLLSGGGVCVCGVCVSVCEDLFVFLPTLSN